MFSKQVFAEEEYDSPSLDDMTLGGKAFDKTPISKPTISSVNIKVDWQLWQKVKTATNPGLNELTALAHDSHSLGIPNQCEYAMAVMAEAIHASPDIARPLFEKAESLAPNLPYPFLADAAYFAIHDPLDFPIWGAKAATGIQNMLEWPDTFYAWALKLFTFFLIAWAFSVFVFTVGQLIRYLPVLVHDATRFMPDGFSNNQSAIILLAVILVPGIILRSPLISAFLMLAFVTLMQNWRERLVSTAIFVSIILIPTFDIIVYKFASYYGSSTQTLASAQYQGCNKDCQLKINAMQVANPNDKMVAYTSLLAAYRSGEISALERIVNIDDEKWPLTYRGHLQNLKGAALIALAKPEDATAMLSSSIQTLNSAAPRFNLMRAYQMQDKLDQASTALNQAVNRDLDRVTAYLRYVRRDVNSFLIVEPIPLHIFHDYQAMSPSKDGLSPVATTWIGLSGSSLRLEQAPWVGFMGLFFVLLGVPLKAKNKASTPCPKCGLARSPEDEHKTSNHKYCLLCYRTFVVGSSMNYEARVFNERILGRRETMQIFGRKILSFLLPGAGHHLAGHAITGFFLSFSILFSILILAKPLGIIRPPFEFFTHNWMWQQSVAGLVLAISVFIILYAILKDIPPIIKRGAK